MGEVALPLPADENQPKGLGRQNLLEQEGADPRGQIDPLGDSCGEVFENTRDNERRAGDRPTVHPWRRPAGAITGGIGGAGMRIVLYAALLVTGFALVSLASFWLAVRPPRIGIPLVPKDYKLPAEEVAIATADGLRLAAWLIARPGAPAIILLHGYPAEKADLLPIAAALHPTFTTLLVDLRYFGRSEGRSTTLGFRERGDLTRAVDFLAERGFTRVGVFGLSLGGAVAVMTAAEDRRIRAVAAYAPFADLKTLGHDLYSTLWVLKYPFVELMSLWARLFLDMDVAELSPMAAARTLSTPVLLIHSRMDEQIPFRHAELLQQALANNPNAEFYLTARGHHGELPRDFEARLARFFLTHLR